MNTNAEFCGVIKWSARGSRIAWLVIWHLLSLEWADSSTIPDGQASGNHLIPMIRLGRYGARGAQQLGGHVRHQHGVEVPQHAQLAQNDAALRVTIKPLKSVGE